MSTCAYLPVATNARLSTCRVDMNTPRVEAKQIEVIKKDQENRDKLWAAIEQDRIILRGEMAQQ